MRIFLLANNWVGWKVAEYLNQLGSNIVGLAIHSPEKSKYAKEIIEALKLEKSKIYPGPIINDAMVIERIKKLKPDICLSVYFDYILKEKFINIFSKGAVNLHPSYLPYNRGNYPNVWSIIDDTPAGATLHYIDAGIDTGSIIAQRKTVVEPTDTGKSLYNKLEKLSLEIFKEAWPSIISGNIDVKPQKTEQGSYHRKKDVEMIDQINLEQSYKAKDLINILRARTFPPYRGAYFTMGDKKIYLKLQLEYEDDFPGEH